MCTCMLVLCAHHLSETSLPLLYHELINAASAFLCVFVLFTHIRYFAPNWNAVSEILPLLLSLWKSVFIETGTPVVHITYLNSINGGMILAVTIIYVHSPFERFSCSISSVRIWGGFDTSLKWTLFEKKKFRTHFVIVTCTTEKRTKKKKRERGRKTQCNSMFH